MHLLAISLLTILAGTLLLAKFRKDMPGKLFAYISWFFLVVGFLLFLGAVGLGICRMTCKDYSCKAGHGHEMMMKNCNMGNMDGCKGGMGKMKMQGCNMGMQGCCGSCMGGMDKGNCCSMSGSMSHDSMMEGCPGHMKMDSTATTVQKE